MPGIIHRAIEPVAASHPELGRLLWMLEDTWSRTLAVINGLDQHALDWAEPGFEHRGQIDAIQSLRAG